MSQQFRTVTTNAGRNAVREALARSGKDIPLTVQVVNIDGTLA